MKVTIEPSNKEFPGATVSIDLRHDDESTPEIVEAVMGALVLYGHSKTCVVEAAAAYAEKNPVTNSEN